MTKTVLFDLDGTLLPMDLDIFIKVYFAGLVKKAAPHGYEPSVLLQTIGSCVNAMVENDGSKSNEKVFWEKFTGVYGQESLQDVQIFEEYYRNEFKEVQNVCGYNPKVKECIRQLREKGFRIVLATNPLFPRIATETRITWAGLTKEDFELVTTYENSRFCKPNPDYYKDVMQQIGVTAEECLMVGNDVEEDMVASQLGMKVFLITDNVINKYNKDISVYPHGSIEGLMEYIGSLDVKGGNI